MPTTPDATPRQLLIAAQHLAAGDPPALAAVAAGLRPSALALLRDTDPDFAAVEDACAEVAARPAKAQNARLAKLARLTLERALADDRPGAAKEILRLLAPPKPAREKAAPAPRKRRAAADDPEAAPEPPPPPDGSRWGMVPDEEEGWVGTDGLPVLPTRALTVVDAPGGPVRVLDVDPACVPPVFLASLETFDAVGVRDFNRSAMPSGGLQWDPVTRTVWCWGEPPERTAAEREAQELPPQ